MEIRGVVDGRWMGGGAGEGDYVGGWFGGIVWVLVLGNDGKLLIVGRGMPKLEGWDGDPCWRYISRFVKGGILSTERH